MSRLLINDEWYESLSSNSYWENEYERLIMDRAAVLYPEYETIPFKTTVRSEHGTARADLALVSGDYQLWWVVEVELAHHSLSNHVLPQVAALATAEYSVAEADYLSARSNLDAGRLREMMRGSQPRVLVVVNGETNWRPHLAIWGSLLATVEVFRSVLGKHVIRVAGDYPKKPQALITRCRADPHIPRLLVIDSPAALPVGEDGRVQLEYGGQITEWERVRSHDRYWLSPLRTSPLPAWESYEIVQADGGRLSIRTER